MKLFILAVQCAGKTTIAKYLRDNTDFNIVEMEDEILRLNAGTWPKEDHLKEEVLIPRILESICAMPEVIFFENHMSVERTVQLKKADFSVVILKVSRDELLRRNRQRIEKEGYDDASIWIDPELENISELEKHKLIDASIDGERPKEEVAADIIKLARKL
jgi:broad-specificity NMP kinase